MPWTSGPGLSRVNGRRRTKGASLGSSTPPALAPRSRQEPASPVVCAEPPFAAIARQVRRRWGEPDELVQAVDEMGYLVPLWYLYKL
jgi:hypothetical protein